MRYRVASILLLATAEASIAQTPMPKQAPPAAPPPQAAPKAATAQTAKDLEIARAHYAALPVAERIAIQSDLVWSGDYNGGVSADFGDRAIAAVKAFQKRSKAKESGILSPQERATLAASVKAQQAQVGWRMVEDPAVAGARLGIPGKLVPQSGIGKSGSRWTSTKGEVQIETFRVNASDGTLAAEFERQKKEPTGRKVEYNVLRPDFFVVAGLQGLKKFYVRAQVHNGEIRGMTVLYDQAMEGIMQPVVVAMSSAFSPFANIAAAAAAKRKVEYSTGIFVSMQGHLLADRQATDSCEAIRVAGRGHAERLADDKGLDVALLRVNGAKGIKPADVSSASATEVTLVGIADPQVQNGGRVVTNLTARLNANAQRLEPAPIAGFAGAPALDRQKQVVGIAVTKLDANFTAQSAFVPGDKLRNFLAGQAVPPATDPAPDPNESVVRIICVRK